MALCSNCGKRQAIVYTSRYVDGKRIDEGYCIRCAYDSGFPGLEDIFKQAGINKENIEEYSDRIESVIGDSNAPSPTEMLRSLLGEDIGDAFDEEYDIDDDDIYDDDAQIGVGVVDRDLGSNDEGDENGLSSLSGANEENEQNNGKNKENGKNTQEKTKKKKFKFLSEFGTNLTLRAKEGKIDRILGRDVEIERVIQILNRRSKNNPVLIGEPGVGKTAVAQGLALKITNGDVPDKLLKMEVWELDIPAMVAGTQFRGMFENRIKGVIKEAMSAGNIILVIDELHSIMGAGESEGSTNAANILKPALARGELRIIGSTTTKEYKLIEKDSALERRFQKVLLNEPSIEDSIEILKGIRDYYEDHHYVTYSDEVIEFAVKASKRYITDRYLPDKAIDLIDEAGSHANLQNTRLIKSVELKDKSERLSSEYTSLVTLMESMSDEEREKNYEKVATLRQDSEIASKEYNQFKDALSPDPITIEDISRVIEMWTGIPLKSISESESEKLIHLEERLHKRVIGQEHAVHAVASAVRRNRSGFSKKNKPASFIFVGPTGVGKTELVKALTEVMFDTENSLIRIDMSEYMEPHSISKLIGSPPGYVGHQDSGQLTEQIRRRPYSVILFDEIEKAHADVFNLLLQLLDEGRLTDSHGVHVNFENTIIIMTSNAGNTSKAPTIGFFSGTEEALESKVDTALKNTFRPEFLNRVDETIIFKELKKDEIRQIAEIMIKEVFDSLNEKKIVGSISSSALDELVKNGYDPKYGARPLRKEIRKRIEDKLSDMFLRGELKNVIKLNIDFVSGEFTFTTVKMDEQTLILPSSNSRIKSSSSK